jgi:general secretion pathway protein D
LTNSIAALLGLAVAAQPILITASYAGETGYSGGSSSSSVAQRELVRRKDYTARGEAALATARGLYREKDFEGAVAQYKLACDLIPNSAHTAGPYAEAVNGFCKASCRFAEQRIAEGRYVDAQNQLKLVLDERYNPRCREAVVILARLETPGYYNQTIGPKFRAKVEQVKQYLLEADGFRETGRYDMAMKRYDQVLALDPYNIAAREGQEQVDLKRDHYADAAYNETRGRLLWQLDSKWAMPVRKFNVTEITTIENNQDAAGTARINAKLQRIILPRLEFREATIREALEFLRKKSVELDTQEPDPARRGVSFVLKLETPSVTPAPAAPAAAGSAIPGLEPIPGAAAAPAAAEAAPAGGAAGNTPITISLQNIPLIEALKYVTSLANLKYKVEPYAVSIVPMGVDTTTLIQKQYKVPPSFITRVSGGGAEAGGGLAPGGPGDITKSAGGGSGIAGRLDAVEFLKAGGVTFPEGASAVYLAGSSTLIVRNTQENLDLIDTLVQNAIQTGPSQVEIEAKFVEITQQNLRELSFDWLLGQANIPGSQKIFGGGGTSGFTSNVNPADFPFVQPGGQPVGVNPVTSGNRSGQLAINNNAIDALLFGAAGASTAAPGMLSLAGVFTDPSYQLVIRALNQKKGVDLLSAPRVTTKSGQRAVIEIIREFRYPTEFDPPQIPQNFGNQGNNNNSSSGLPGAVTINVPGSFPVTPTTPTAFETRNTGVTLEVEPVVGPDGYTIDLSLVPQVVEFEGFINYGSPITAAGLNVLTGQPTQTVITPNVINQPIFSTRKVTTSVSVFDGQTVVLGGLMREDVQKVEDKTPFLGDIPLIGRLFRSNVDQHLKRNLVIFVSARLINPAGEPIRSEEEPEEEVTPQPPAEITPELPLMPKK